MAEPPTSSAIPNMSSYPTPHKPPTTFLSLPRELRQHILILSIDTSKIDQLEPPHFFRKSLIHADREVIAHECDLNYRTIVENRFQRQIDKRVQKASEALKSTNSWVMTLRQVHRDLWDDIDFMAKGRISRRALKKRLVAEDDMVMYVLNF